MRRAPPRPLLVRRAVWYLPTAKSPLRQCLRAVAGAGRGLRRSLEFPFRVIRILRLFASTATRILRAGAAESHKRRQLDCLARAKPAVCRLTGDSVGTPFPAIIFRRAMTTRRCFWKEPARGTESDFVSEARRQWRKREQASGRSSIITFPILCSSALIARLRARRFWGPWAIGPTFLFWASYKRRAGLCPCSALARHKPRASIAPVRGLRRKPRSLANGSLHFGNLCVGILPPRCRPNANNSPTAFFENALTPKVVGSCGGGTVVRLSVALNP